MEARCRVTDDTLVARIVRCSFSTPYSAGIIIKVFIKYITRIYFPYSFRNRNAFFKRSVGIEIIFSIKTIGYISPYFTNLLPFAIGAQQVGLVVKLGNFTLRIVKIESDTVIEIFDTVSPVQFQFPTISFQIRSILLGSSHSHNPRQIHSRCQHTFCITPIPIESTIQAIIKKSEVNTEVERIYFFPGERTADHRRSGQSRRSLTVYQPIGKPWSHLRYIRIIVR